MKRKGFITLAIIALATTVPALAQAETVTTSTSIPFTKTLVNPCMEEIVDFSGDQHILIHVTFDPEGGFHLKFERDLEDVSGTGRVTGKPRRLPRHWKQPINRTLCTGI
ncbi:hypothetical protein MYX65_11675 [Acidobacteria bacterium AH-259-L09]|nr:hypothetical protein [Acidobacteria bacterium AH-259-L09]